MDLVERYKHKAQAHTQPVGVRASTTPETRPDSRHLIIAGMDLRGDIHAHFGLKDGEAYIMRIAGPLIPIYNPDCSASQMFQENLMLAIHDLRVDTVTLLGHRGCAAADKLSRNLYGSGDIPWMKSQSSQIMQHALNNCGNQNQACIALEIEKQMIIHGIKTLFDYPAVLEGMRVSRLSVEGLQLDVGHGRLYKLGADGKTFRFDLVAMQAPPREESAA